MSETISVIALLTIPFALGRGLLTPQTRVGTCWWVGTMVAAVTVIVGHGIGLSQYVVLGVIFGAALILPLWTLRRRERCLPVGPREILYAGSLSVMMLPLLLAVLLRTLDYPALGVDAIVIWYAKAKALYEWVPLSDLPFRNYPALGPGAWMLVLKWVGSERENIGRVIFVLPYFFWFFGFLELFDRPYPWVSAIALPALAVLFFDFERFTRGDQDGLVMMAAGMAALFMAKTLVGISTGNRTEEGLMALGATRQERQDCYLAACFAGALGLIKQEGAVLGLILMVMWVSILLALGGRSGWPRLLRRLLPSGIAYMGLAALWPVLLLLHGVELGKIQGDAFTVASVSHALGNLDRWPSIRPYVLDHYHGERPVLLASILVSAVAAGLLARIRAALLFLWGVYGLHALFVMLVFLSTRQPLEWHLQTAFDRLMLQGRFTLATLLCLSVVMLSARLGSTMRTRFPSSPSSTATATVHAE